MNLCSPKNLTFALLLLPLTMQGVGCSSHPVATRDEVPEQVDMQEDASKAIDMTLEPLTLRVATFNASLFRSAQGKLITDLESGEDAQARRVAELLQRVRPDVVLINEFDQDDEGRAAQLFSERYLSVSQNGAEPLQMGHWYVPTSNTGQPSNLDLDQSGEVVTTPGTQAYGNDSYGFGVFPGQYGMVLYSRFPLGDDVRTFQRLVWSDMPDNLLPTTWYSSEAAATLRLSSKNHVDVTLDLGDGRVLHVLASHPTPPSFDGPEDRNGRRNHDEIRFWKDYITGGEQAAYIRDDQGTRGGSGEEAMFVILGDLNSDPLDGDSLHEGIVGLLEHPRVTDPLPASEGAVTAATRDGGANVEHDGAAKHDTADFSDGRVGNLRVDYVLPSSNLTVEESGVFWPEPDAPDAELASVSDHHLVWVDVTVSGP